MSFKPISELISPGVSFNSSVSSNFKDLYDKILYDKYRIAESSKPSKTFSPSSFRCDRLSFFRLRGVDPDPVDEINMELEFSAMLGTACHEEIQRNLIENLGDQWIPVSKYLETFPISHEYSLSKFSEFESRIEFYDPPVKFGCDGILKIGNEFYLLEIKTSEYQSFKALKEPKPQHLDQIKCYCALLELHKALVFYQDRLYGDTKCYEIDVKDYEIQEVFDRMYRVLECVENNIAPSRLDKSDYWCTYCKYKNKCQQWG